MFDDMASALRSVLAFLGVSTPGGAVMFVLFLFAIGFFISLWRYIHEANK